MLRTSLSVSLSVLTSVLILTALIYTFDLLASLSDVVPVLYANPNPPTNSSANPPTNPSANHTNFHSTQIDLSINKPMLSVDPSQKPLPVRLILLPSMIGYIEPCGCTIDLKLGGLDRIAQMIEKSRKDMPTLVFVVGNYLFEDHVPESRIAQDEAKADLIHRVFKEIKIDGIVPGLNDLSRGSAFLENLQNKHPLPRLSDARIFEIADLKIGVIGISSIDQVDLAQRQKIIQDQITLMKIRGVQTIIALSSLNRQESKVLAQQFKEIDFWVLGDHPLEEKNVLPLEIHQGQTQASNQVDQAFFIEAGDRGRFLGILDLYHAQLKTEFTEPKGELLRQKQALALKLKMQKTGFGMKSQTQQLITEIDQLTAKIDQFHMQSFAKAQNIKSFEFTLYPISKDEPQSKSILDQILVYQKSLKEINLANAGKVIPLQAGQNGYAGNTECAMCHPTAQKIWEESRHAKAWETLVKDDKTFDVECVSCHVTGWQQPGGTALGHTQGKEAVQCEACHGPSSKHAEMGGGESYTKKKVPKEVCTTCHNQLHSPKFNYETYLQKIVVPGHGLPQNNGGSDTTQMPNQP